MRSLHFQHYLVHFDANQKMSLYIYEKINFLSAINKLFILSFLICHNIKLFFTAFEMGYSMQNFNLIINYNN